MKCSIKSLEKNYIFLAKRFFLCFAALAVFFSLAPPEAQAALARRGAGISVAEACNPQASVTDLALPLPCGGSMVFKAVGIRAQGFLQDLDTLFGSDESRRGGREYYERRYNAAVSGPFAAADLPAAWRARLPRPDREQYYYYFIGKYEVSVFQWRTVMEGWCPSESSPLSAEDARPKTEVSWYEATEFARKYTEWLLANHAASLPRFAGDGKNVGYARLPTEAEWEYAARGGHAVRRHTLRQDEFFPLPEDANLGDYAVFRPEGAARIEEQPQRIGSRSPNPLDLYDTAGNAAEMVLDPFHFSLGGRLHGSAGGFVRKGGSYLSGQTEILPGRREEVAFFQLEGPVRAKDLGFRLALSGINTPGGSRSEALEKEWKRTGEGQVLLDQSKNPLEEVDRLMAGAASRTEKENLARLRAVLKDNNIALERQRNKSAEGLIRSSLYMVEAVRSYAVRRKMALNYVTELEIEMNAARRKKLKTTDLQKQLTLFKNNEADLRHAMEAGAGFYRARLEEVRGYPSALFDAQLKLLSGEFTANDVFTRSMKNAFTIYEKHVQALRGGSALNQSALLKDMLPENLRTGLKL